MFAQPEWLAVVETGTFLILVVTLMYGRLVNWKKYHERTSSLESKFEQYQKDFSMFYSTCEVCRREVREHHEDAEKHVTKPLAEQIARMADSIEKIKDHLMIEGRK